MYNSTAIGAASSNGGGVNSTGSSGNNTTTTAAANSYPYLAPSSTISTVSPSILNNSLLTTVTATAANKVSKQCNCKNSRCLKLYCECFASGAYCEGCNCKNCFNDIPHE